MRKGHIALIGLVANAFAGSATPSFESIAWPSPGVVAENRRQCPRLDLTGITYGSWYDETDRASGLLSPRRKRAIAAEMKARCASETAGFTCETKVMFTNMDRWGLTPRFVGGMCRRYWHCRGEPAAC